MKMISYKPLKHQLVEQGLTWKQLRERCEPHLGVSTTDRISRGDQVSLDVIDRICSALNVQIQQVIEHIPDQQREYKGDQQETIEQRTNREHLQE